MTPISIRNPDPRPMGTPCPQCNSTRPANWKGPCRPCLETRRPRRRAKPTDSPHIHDLVAWDLALRKQLGIRTYGQALQANNGRDALWDAYEECLDLAAYLRQAITERDTPQCPEPAQPSPPSP